MELKNAKYFKGDPAKPDENSCVNVTIDGILCHVPLDPENRHYKEILKQVSEGKITIKEAD